MRKNETNTSSLLFQDYIETPPMSDEEKSLEGKSTEEKEGDFANFRISAKTCALLREKSINFLFPIQCQTFDHVYDGKDVVAQASE